MKRCIFHYLHPIEDRPGIGSALRPCQMLRALRAIGYEVDVVAGYSHERKKKIRAIKKRIRDGVVYDFVYSESVNDPTLLSDSDHLPRHPFLDFRFLGFCRKKGVPVGLFYRDMHWQFPVYRERVPHWKQMITLPLFRRDLRMYRKNVDVLYVPSERMGEIVPHSTTKPLPPGGQKRPEVLDCRASKAQEKGSLRVFYVGNVMGVYDLTDFCKAVKETENVYLTICTPQTSWEQMQRNYAPYLCDRIRVVHKSSGELQPYYEEADVFCCCLEVNQYTALAMPIKVFESISYGVPVMISDGIAAGELIAREKCGWIVQNNAEDYARLLKFLRDEPDDVRQKTKNTMMIAPTHSWESRAQQVAEDLTNLK